MGFKLLFFFLFSYLDHTFAQHKEQREKSGDVIFRPGFLCEHTPFRNLNGFMILHINRSQFPLVKIIGFCLINSKDLSCYKILCLLKRRLRGDLTIIFDESYIIFAGWIYIMHKSLMQSNFICQ